MCPDIDNIKSFIIHSSGCVEFGSEVGETRYANIKVKIVMRELSSYSRYSTAVACHMGTPWGVSEEAAVMGVTPGGITYEADLKVVKNVGGGGRITRPGRWRGPHSSVRAECHGAQPSTSGTHWRLICASGLRLRGFTGKKTVVWVRTLNKDGQASPSLALRLGWMRGRKLETLMPSFRLKFLIQVPQPRDIDSTFQINLMKT